jgi:protein-S-isoprenylcysteine O-methyltransferase Ste14
MKKSIQLILSTILSIGIFTGSGFIVNPDMFTDIHIGVVILSLIVLLNSQPPIKKKELFNPNDKFSMLGILIMAITFYNVIVLEWSLKSIVNHNWSILGLLGFVMIFGGLKFRIDAIKALDYCFSNDAQIKKEHKIIDIGIYAKVRHPSYTGAICTMMGTLLWLETWNNFGVCLGLISLAYWHRITEEEKLLTKHFGEKYIQYRQKTGLFFPKISLKTFSGKLS